MSVEPRESDRNAAQAIGEYVSFTASYSAEDAEKQISRAMQPEREAAERLASAAEKIECAATHASNNHDAVMIDYRLVEPLREAIADYRKATQ